jgi:hypothetical protein
MDKRKLEALARRNAAKASGALKGSRKNFGKKYDPNLKDEPNDAKALEERDANKRLFNELRKRPF